MCENPVEYLELKNKGYIKEDFDADLTIVDLKKEQMRLKMKIFKVNVDGHHLIMKKLKVVQ